MKHPAEIPGLLPTLAMIGTIVLFFFLLRDDCNTPKRRERCRDEATITHRHCDKSPEICEQIARDALNLCLGNTNDPR